MHNNNFDITGPYVIAFARAIEAAACAERDARIAELEVMLRAEADARRAEINARLELEHQLEESRVVLKETGLLLHHFWCDVQMNDYSFEKLNKGIEAIDEAMQKGQA